MGTQLMQRFAQLYLIGEPNMDESPTPSVRSNRLRPPAGGSGNGDADAVHLLRLRPRINFTCPDGVLDHQRYEQAAYGARTGTRKFTRRTSMATHLSALSFLAWIGQI